MFRFFKLNTERVADWGSIYQALDVYGIKIGKSKEDIKDEEPQAPAADRAGSSPGGA